MKNKKLFSQFLAGFLISLLLLTGCSSEVSSTETKNTQIVNQNEENNKNAKTESNHEKNSSDNNAKSGEVSENNSSNKNSNKKSKNTEENNQVNTDKSKNKSSIDENGTYTSKEEVALYIHTFGKLPSNYVTKKEAQENGWDSKAGNLDKVLPGKSIGGDKFGNREELLPTAKGRKYYECDINYTGGHRNAERVVYSNDGLVFYTKDHYKTFEQLY